MQRSKVEIFAHMVWATHQRYPFITDTVEDEIHRCIRAETLKLHCDVLAIGGMPDHVHLVVKLHSTVALAKLAQKVKGISSLLANDHLGFENAFDWQDHYGAFSVSRSHLKRVISYVDHQKERHARGNLWEDWKKPRQKAMRSLLPCLKRHGRATPAPSNVLPHSSTRRFSQCGSTFNAAGVALPCLLRHGISATTTSQSSESSSPVATSVARSKGQSCRRRRDSRLGFEFCG